MYDAEFTDGNLGDNFQTQEMKRFPEGSKRGDGSWNTVFPTLVIRYSKSIHKCRICMTGPIKKSTFFMTKKNEP